MGLLQQLSRLVLGEDQEQSAFVRALEQSYADCSERADLLHRHAELAPQEASARVLRQLADEERAAQGRFDGELRERGLQVPAGRCPPPMAAAANHWQRLVQDLELHRTAVRNLHEFAVRFAERTPDTDSLFAVIGRQEAAHCTTLRALIARADPRSLD